MKLIMLKFLTLLVFVPAAALSQGSVTKRQVNVVSTPGNTILTNSVSGATNETGTSVDQTRSSGAVVALWIKDGITNVFPLIPLSRDAAIVVGGPAAMTPTELDGDCIIRVEPQAFPPGQTIIVPQGSSATITMQASPDLLNWTNIITQTYTNISGNMFFRVSAQRL